MNLFRFFSWSVYKQLSVLFLIGLAARLAVTVFLADNRTLYFEHMLIAKNLLDGKGYVWDEWGRAALQVSSMIPPLYVYWCEFFMWLSPANFTIMYAAQALVAASGCIPAFRIGRHLFSERVGFLFAALWAFFPEFVFIHSRPVAESIYAVLILWMIERYFVLRDKPVGSRSTVRMAAFTGILCGTAMLVKEGAAIVSAAILIALMIRVRPWGGMLKSHIIPLSAGAALVLAPWMIRNVVVQGEFVPLRTAYGINWWVANHPGSAGNDRYGDGKYVFSELPKLNPAYNDYMNRILPYDEQDRDWTYAAEVVRFIKENPTEYFTLCAKRLLYYVWFVPGHQLAANPIYRASWILLLLLAIPGAIIMIRGKRMDPVFPLTIIGFLLLYIPVSVLPRYRTITVALCLLFAAVTVDRLLSRRTTSHSAG